MQKQRLMLPRLSVRELICGTQEKQRSFDGGVGHSVALFALMHYCFVLMETFWTEP